MSNVSSSSIPTEPSVQKPVVPWNPWLGVLFVIIVYYASQLLSGIFVSVYPALNNWSRQRTLEWLDGSVTIQFIFILIAEALALGALYLFLRYYKVGFGSIGLRRPRWSDLGYGLLALPVYFLLFAVTAGVISYLVPGLDVNQEQQLGFSDVYGAPALIMTFISLVVLPPLVEEIMVRGFLYGSLKKAVPLFVAVITTSALFAAAHLPEGGPAGPLYIAAIDTFVLSLVLIYLREKTDGLWAPITLHAIKNGIAFTILFVLHAA